MPKASSNALETAELAGILASAMDAIIAIDESQRVILFNRAAEEMFGCPAAAALGSPIDRFIPERYREKHADHIREFAETGVSTRRMGAFGDIWGLRADGEEFPIEASISQMRTDSRTHLTVILRDISQRLEAEQLLREAVAQSTAILEAAVDGIITINERGTIESFNRAAERIFGYPAREVLERNVRILMPAPNREEHDGHLEHFLETGQKRIIGFRREVTGLRKDGRTFPMDLAVSEGFTGERRFFTGIVRDLSERAAAQAALAASEARFRTLATNAPVAIFQTDPQGECLYVNPRWCEFTGLSQDEALGQGWTQALHPDDRDRSVKEWAESIASGLDVLPLSDQRVRAPDGRVTWLAGSAVSLRDESGDLAGYIGTLIDLTERRRAQEAEKLASIATLTAGIAHDVGAPMTAILGYAEMMQKSLIDEKNQRRAGIIVEQVKRISELIQALLNMARPGVRAFISVELGQILDKSLEFYREKLRSRGIEVERSFEAVPPVAGDPDRLQQVFLNLVINAADAMPDGGALRVTLWSPDARHVEVRLADTGTGIPPDDLKQIFEPFYTTKERGRGTGLGLIVARAIISEHHGVISVESELGKGTEFTVRFDLPT
jgi:PAS domain S-box-containing protein